MKKIYLVSHYAASSQHKDAPLTTEGTRQAQLLSIYLQKHDVPIDKIVSSTYFRAVESISPYAKQKGMKVEGDNRLHEFILSDELVEDWGEEFERAFTDHSYQLPGGETVTHAVSRVNHVLADIDQSDAEQVIVVTHRNLLALVLKHYDPDFTFDDWKELKHQDIFILTIEDGQMQSLEKQRIY